MSQKFPTTCKLCGSAMLLTKLSALRRPYCSSCATKQGRCSICRRAQDTPAFRTCTRCREIHRQQVDRIFNRTGKRSTMPEWQIRSIEECKRLADEAHKKFVTKETTNG